MGAGRTSGASLPLAFAAASARSRARSSAASARVSPMAASALLLAFISARIASSLLSVSGLVLPLGVPFQNVRCMSVGAP